MLGDTPYAVTPTDSRNDSPRIRAAIPNPDRDLAQLDDLAPAERLRLLAGAARHIGVEE